MAVDVLTAVVENFILKHNVYHDIESFTYVFGYAVIRHYASDPAVDPVAREELQEIYREAFGHISVREILTNRTGTTTDSHPVGWLPCLFQVVPDSKEDADTPPSSKRVLRDWCTKTFPAPFLELFHGIATMHHEASLGARPKLKKEEDLRKKLEEIFSYEQLGGLLNAAIVALEQDDTA